MDLITISGAIALGVYIHARRCRPLLLLPDGVPLSTSLDHWEYLGEGERERKGMKAMGAALIEREKIA
jgi:hypothetical protein